MWGGGVGGGGGGGVLVFFFFNDTATTEIYTLSLHDALPIYQAFRLGGDEFLVLIADDLDLEGLVERGEHLLNELQRPYWIGDRSIQIDASIGVVDRSAGDLSKMLRSADLAMYAAKEAGGAVRPWDDAMVESQLRKERIQLELQSIRDRHSSEFEQIGRAHV